MNSMNIKGIKGENKVNKVKIGPVKWKVSQESHIQRTFKKQGQDLTLLTLSTFKKATELT